MKIVDHITKADERIVGIISGNVGSGKTILAFEMLRRAMSKFNNKNCIYSLVNATVRDILEGVFDSKIALYTGSVARSNQIKNIVIIDEAHRITDIEATIKKLIDKSRILNVMRPHIYFDDQMGHLDHLDKIPAVHIPFGVVNKN